MSDDNRFTVAERATLHSLAEMFSDKEDRDELRRLLDQGVTIREITLAYKTNRRMISTLKAAGGLIILLGGSWTAIKGLGIWPR